MNWWVGAGGCGWVACGLMGVRLSPISGGQVDLSTCVFGLVGGHTLLFHIKILNSLEALPSRCCAHIMLQSRECSLFVWLVNDSHPSPPTHLHTHHPHVYTCTYQPAYNAGAAG